MNLREIDSPDEAVQGVADLEVRFVFGASLAASVGQCGCRRLSPLIELTQAALDFTITLDNLRGVEIVQLESLTQRKHVLGAVVPG